MPATAPATAPTPALATATAPTPAPATAVYYAMRIASFSARNPCKSFARNCFADLFRLYNRREEFRFGRDVLSEDLLCEPCFLNVLFVTCGVCKHLFD